MRTTTISSVLVAIIRDEHHDTLDCGWTDLLHAVRPEELGETP